MWKTFHFSWSMNRAWNKRTGADGRPAWWRQTVCLWAEGMTNGSTRVMIWRKSDRSKWNKQSTLNKEITHPNMSAFMSVSWTARCLKEKWCADSGSKSPGKQTLTYKAGHPLLLFGYCFTFSWPASDPTLYSAFFAFDPFITFAIMKYVYLKKENLVACP